MCALVRLHTGTTTTLYVRAHTSHTRNPFPPECPRTGNGKICNDLGACLAQNQSNAGVCECPTLWHGSTCEVSTLPVLNCTLDSGPSIPVAIYNGGVNALRFSWCTGTAPNLHCTSCMQYIGAASLVQVWTPAAATAVRLRFCTSDNSRCTDVVQDFVLTKGEQNPKVEVPSSALLVCSNSTTCPAGMVSKPQWVCPVASLTLEPFSTARLPALPRGAA